MDSYDVAEPTSKPTPPVKREPTPPEPIKTEVKIENGFASSDSQKDGGSDGPMDIPTHEQNSYTNGQNGIIDSGWNNGLGNDSRGTRLDVAAEQDSGGIGIKEDG